MRRTFSKRSYSLAVSRRHWGGLMLAAFLALLCLFLLLFKPLQESETAAQGFLNDAVTPVLIGLTEPVTSVKAFLADWQSWQALQAENNQLKADKQRLLQWQHRIATLEAENNLLRDLLRYRAPPFSPVVTSPVMGQSASPYGKALYIPVGQRDGVQKAMAVVSPEGLVGRIREAGEHSGRIMPLTDINSRIAVMTTDGGHRAIAMGQNRPLLKLDFIEKPSALKPGDTIVTSGDGGLLPRNLPVGTVVTVEADHILVKPAISFGKLDSVTVMRLQEAEATSQP